MTRIMYDDVNVASIPSDATMVAGYVDGLYANSRDMQRRFPHAVVVRIAVSSHTNDGHVLDVETGDATPAESVNWVRMRRNTGHDPSIYCSLSVWPMVRKAFRDANIPEPHYWIAHWGPSHEIPQGVVALQYDHDRPYDISAVVDYWPGVDAPNNPRPVPGPSLYTVKKGDTLSQIAVTYHLTLNQLLALNPNIKNPDLITVGEVIRISGKDTSPHTNAIYVVQTGDSLSSIAAAHKLTLAQIEKLNPQITNPNLIYPGQKIYL